MANSERRVVLRTVLIVAAALAVIFGIKFWQQHAARSAEAHRGPYEVSVSAEPVIRVSWHPEIHAVASLVATAGVDLTPQLSGQVTGIYFHSGEHVKKGDLLIQLDNSNQLASLAEDRANEMLAQINYRRARHLYAARATSLAALDTARANEQSAKAAVANILATLAKLAVRAPFSGWMGVRQVSLGEYLSPGTEIAPLNVWNPLRAEFTVPQSQIGSIHPGQAVNLEVDAFPNRLFPGRIAAIDSQINPSTRNVTVEAVVRNPRLWLRPGMFGDARILIGVAQTHLAVPTVAITYNTFGDYVYVVKKRKEIDTHKLQVAIATPVKTGLTRGRLTEILGGLKAGELVVTAGQIKLHNGMPVMIHRHGAH